MQLKALSKLEAVNIVLTNSQLSPVESLESGDLDAETAEQLLNESTVEVQQRAWDWNTEVFDLSPDNDGFIILPPNTLSVDPLDRTLDYVQRGSKLYNKTDHTYKFTSKVECKLVVALEFEELPQVFRRYLALKSSRVFQQRTLGDEMLNQYITTEERTAWAELMKEDIRSKDYNHITGGPVSAKIVSRRTPKTLLYPGQKRR